MSILDFLADYFNQAKTTPKAKVPSGISSYTQGYTTPSPTPPSNYPAAKSNKKPATSISRWQVKAPPKTAEISLADKPRQLKVPPQLPPEPAKKLPSAPIQEEAAPIPQEPTGPSALDIYMKMLDKFDPAGMSSAQYAPMYDMLNKLNADATKRYNYGTKNVGNMYDSLVADIKGDGIDTTKRYNASDAAIKKDYSTQQATLNTGRTQDKQETADMLKQLGVEAAAPASLATADSGNQFWDNMAASQNQSATTANIANKNSEQDYIRSMAQRAGFEGKAQQSDLISQLNDVINTNEAKRFETKGAQGKSTADYKLAELGLYGDLAGKQASNSADYARLALDASQFNQTRADKERAAQIQASQFETSQGLRQSTAQAADARAREAAAQKLKSPYDILSGAATGYNTIWPTEKIQQGMADMVSSQFATNSVADDGSDWKLPVGPTNTKADNLQEFIKQLMEENPHLAPESQAALRSMATNFFNSMIK